jgi:hypothetical protein
MRQRAPIYTLGALCLAVLTSVPAFAAAPPGDPHPLTLAHCAAGHRCRTICASKPAGCHAAHSVRSALGQSARERACGAAGGSWTCCTEAPIACYCAEP